MKRGTLAVMAAFTLASCSSSGSAVRGDHAAPPIASSVHVIYQLFGTADVADITYSTGDSGTQQQQGIGVPMMNKSGQSGLRFTAQPGDFLYFSAQNTGASGALTCVILEQEHHRLLTQHTSTGAYSIVTCEGSA